MNVERSLCSTWCTAGVLLTFFFVDGGKGFLENAPCRVQFGIANVKEARIHPDRLVGFELFHHCVVQRSRLVKFA